MKKISLFSFVALVALFTSLSAFKTARTAVVEEDTRNLASFRKIGLAYPANVVLRQGSKQSVKLEGSAEQLAQVVTEVENGRLTIKRKDELKNSNWNFSNNDRITIYITVPEVEQLSVSGSGKIKGENMFKASALDLSVSGSGGIDLDAKADRVSSRISGSGSILLRGEGKETTVAVSGSGSLKGYDFKTAEAKVSISGSGSCEINATSTLKSSISGSGRVSYEGSPSVDSRVSGSGSVRKRG